MDTMLIGREKEKQVLLNAINEEYSQFIAVYGRRRVGKTFLIRETFGNRFDFQFTGAANLTARKQLEGTRKVQRICQGFNFWKCELQLFSVLRWHLLPSFVQD